VSEGDEGPQDIEDDGGADLSVVVKLAEVLNGRDSTLVVLEDVGLRREGELVSFLVKIKMARKVDLTSSPARISSRT